MQITELFAAVTEWAIATGDRDISKRPGLWHRKTEKIGNIGPLDVRINPHDETIDAVPPFNIRIGMDDKFPGLIALIGPTDGIVMASPIEGEDEAGLIAHFKANAAVLGGVPA